MKLGKMENNIVYLIQPNRIVFSIFLSQKQHLQKLLRDIRIERFFFKWIPIFQIIRKRIGA